MITFFQKIIQAYRDLKLSSKLALVLILIVAIPALVVGYFFQTRLYDMTVSYTISQEQAASAKTAPIIMEKVQEVVDTQKELTEIPFFRKLFYQPINMTFSSLMETKEAKEFGDKVHSLTESNLITNVRFYIGIPNEDSPLYTHENGQSILQPMSNARGTYWYGIFQGTRISELFCPSFYLGAREQQELGDMAYIKSTTFYYRGKVYPCYIAVYFSEQPFKEILSENLSMKGSVSYIMNERNSLVSSSNESLSGIYWLNYETIQSSFMSSNNFIEQTILDEKVYVGFYNIQQPDWFMVTVLPSTPLIQESISIILQYLFIYVAFLIIALLAAIALARSITKRISSVSAQMQQVRFGPPIPMESPTSHDEVGDLIDTYNYMTTKMNQLIEKQGKAAEDLRIAEFNSLQAQINPHFLYNTMDMINWLAMQGRNSEVSSAVQKLSKFYKLTLSNKKSISTIANEEEHVSIYITIQNMRFHDGIDFVSDIPDNLMDYQIPKLTLQPVIENAILHGILSRPEKSGTIVLTGWQEDHDIVLLISDDGIGISPEILPTLTSQNKEQSLENENSKGTNIAVYNIHRRLQILYGENYGLSYSSELNKGTEVQIRLPAHSQNEIPEKNSLLWY